MCPNGRMIGGVVLHERRDYGRERDSLCAGQRLYPRADRHVPVEIVQQVNRRVGSAMPLQEGGDASDAPPPFHVCHT